MSIDEVYNYIKLQDKDKVKEYLESLPDVLDNANLNIIKSLFYYALDWKATEIVEMLVDHWRADPLWYERFTIYYTSWNTNKLPSLSLTEFIYYGKETNKKEC